METRLMKEFPTVDNGLLSEPTVIGDRNGLAMVWYLPGILSRARQVRLKTLIYTEIRNRNHYGNRLRPFRTCWRSEELLPAGE